MKCRKVSRSDCTSGLRYGATVKAGRLSTVRKLCLAIPVALSLSGCAVTGSGEPFGLETPAENEAIVYHYRLKATKGSARQWDVLSNEEPMARIGNGGYFKELVPPGDRTYLSKANVDGGLFGIATSWIWNALEDYEEVFRLNVESGNTYFLRYDFGVGQGQPTVVTVPEEEALSEIGPLLAFPPIVIERPPSEQD